jgi:hypothetical protein
MGDAQRQSRRALLTAAASGAAALAANAALGGAAVRAADAPLLMNVENAATAKTTLTATLETDTVLKLVNDAVNGGGTAVSGTSGPGAGVAGFATTGTGVYGNATGIPGRGIWGEAPPEGTGVVGNCGDPTLGPSDTSLSGVFGYSVAGDGETIFGTGVWGDSPDIGVYGSGGVGVYGAGDGGIGVFGDGGTTGTGLYGYSKAGTGLYVSGKVALATRSGRLAVAAGKTSVYKNVTGVTSSSIVIAVLQTTETGTWVRAAVAATGKFTVYFNKALPSSSVVGWLILN